MQAGTCKKPGAERAWYPFTQMQWAVVEWGPHIWGDRRINMRVPRTGKSWVHILALPLIVCMALDQQMSPLQVTVSACAKWDEELHCLEFYENELTSAKWLFSAHSRGGINATSLSVHEVVGGVRLREQRVASCVRLKPRAFRALVAMEAFRGDSEGHSEGQLDSDGKSGVCQPRKEYAGVWCRKVWDNIRLVEK